MLREQKNSNVPTNPVVQLAPVFPTSKLSTNWVFFKQEAWPCHVCPRATKIHAFGPISTDIGDGVAVCGR